MANHRSNRLSRAWPCLALVAAACASERAPIPFIPARSALATGAPEPSGRSVAADSAFKSGPPEVSQPPVGAGYPWLTSSSAANAPPPHQALEERFAAPAGYRRITLSPRSFGAFLRRLPLAEPGTPVRTYRGATLRESSDSRIAAVAALDVGSADLQQCADSIMRLYAEHRFAAGDHALSFDAAAGAALPFSRWLAGERVVVEGNRLRWEPRGKPSKPTHEALRGYLDTVFAWANTGSLAREAKVVPKSDLRPGDFFVLQGNPGHAVLILDVATGPKGEVVGLLGQGFMPAQSFHVLRAESGSPWFVLDGPSVQTPFWAPFPWSSLRRLD